MQSWPHQLPLEDAWNDVLGKAIRGSGVDEKNLAPSANLIPAKLKTILAGELPSDDALRRLSVGVGLQPTALINLAHGKYRPRDPVPTDWPGVWYFATDYMGMSVNHALIWDLAKKEGMLVDTGSDLKTLRSLISEKGIQIKHLVLTHTHGDHIAMLNEIVEEWHPTVFAPKGEPLPDAHLIEEGWIRTWGEIQVRAISTMGHSPDHLSYVFESKLWKAPVCVVGDALFAGSMGGGNVSYSSSRENLQDKILSLPGETLLIPGHGPATTVGEELQNNPFA